MDTLLTLGDYADALAGDPELTIAPGIQSLLDDLREDRAWALHDWTVHKYPLPDATTDNQVVFIAYNKSWARAGICQDGSGSNGVSIWTDADSPDDALRRYIEDDLIR